MRLGKQTHFHTWKISWTLNLPRSLFPGEHLFSNETFMVEWSKEKFYLFSQTTCEKGMVKQPCIDIFKNVINHRNVQFVEQNMLRGQN